eukprot:g38996.t1
MDYTEAFDKSCHVGWSRRLSHTGPRVFKKTFAFIAQIFEYRSWDVMLRLYRTLVRLLLEYCVQFWLPCYGKDIIKLEKVQKRFTRTLPEMKGLNYKEGLDRLRLFSPEFRRLRGVLIEVYKIVRGIDKVNSRVDTMSGIFPAPERCGQ